MNRILRSALSLAAVAFAGTLLAQEIYTPTRSAKDQGISLKSWGSGTISETDETAFEGSTSIRVSSRNYFQGGIVTFANPVDLSKQFADKNSLLQFTMHVPDSGKVQGGKQGGKGGGAAAGGPSGAGGSGLAGSDGGGAAGGAKGGGAGGGGEQRTTTLTSERVLETVRVVITTSDGLRSEGFIEVKGKVPDERGWMKCGVPLNAIAGFGRTNKAIQSIAVACDAVSTFYLGQMNVTTDSTPVYGEMNHGNMNLALGDEVTFVGSGYAGASPLKFEWDFDAADGIQADAVGQAVKRKFRKPGEFEVTLTVSDVFGLKAPYTTKIRVTVNP